MMDRERHPLEVDGETDWDEIDRIANETVRRGDGVPLDEVLAWMKSWGGKTKVPPPRR